MLALQDLQNDYLGEHEQQRDRTHAARTAHFISPLTLIAVVFRQQTVTDTAVTQRFCLYLSLCQQLNRGSRGLKIEGMFSNMTHRV